MVRIRHIVSLLLLLLPLCAPAQNTRKQENRKAVLQREIEEINRQLKANAKNSSRALSDLQLVQKKIANRKELIAESEKDIRALGDSIRVFQKEIDREQARLDTLNLYFNRLVRSAYKNRDNRLWYMYILASENLGQGFRRFSYLRRDPLGRLPPGVPLHPGDRQGRDLHQREPLRKGGRSCGS